MQSQSLQKKNFKEQSSSDQLLRGGNNNGAASGSTNRGNANQAGLNQKDYNMLLASKLKYIVKVQAWWRGNSARRLIGMLRAKQMGSSKYFTQEEARETVTKRLY
jgi:hypothetical protein